MAQEGLGRLYNTVMVASGVHIPLTRAQYVDFKTYEADGSTILTLRESIGGASEQLLTNITKFYKSPGAGGTWTKVTQVAASIADLADDAVNNSMVVSVRARSLSDGYDSVEATVDGGICIAHIYELSEQSAPEALISNIVA